MPPPGMMSPGMPPPGMPPPGMPPPGMPPTGLNGAASAANGLAPNASPLCMQAPSSTPSSKVPTPPPACDLEGRVDGAQRPSEGEAEKDPELSELFRITTDARAMLLLITGEVRDCHSDCHRVAFRIAIRVAIRGCHSDCHSECHSVANPPSAFRVSPESAATCHLLERR